MHSGWHRASRRGGTLWLLRLRGRGQNNSEAGGKDLDRLDEAADLMRRALTIKLRDEKLFMHYATMLLDQHKVDDAATANERALALNANNHDAVNLAGRIAFERGDLAAALTHYRRALTLKPDLADAYNNIGNVLKELGQLQEAQDAYLQAIRLDPNIAGVYVNLADSKKFAPGDPHLATMEALAAKIGRLVQDRPHATRFRARQGLWGFEGLPALVHASSRRQCGQARDDLL